MTNNRTQLLIFTLTALAGLATAQAKVQINGQGFRLMMIPTDHNAHSNSQSAKARCTLRVNRRSVLLHLSSTPFVHLEDADATSDAFLAARVVRSVGQIAVSPAYAIDHTHVAKDDRTAAIALGVQGNGMARLEMEVGIDDPHAVAGRHGATVYMTVTGQ